MKLKNLFYKLLDEANDGDTGGAGSGAVPAATPAPADGSPEPQGTETPAPVESSTVDTDVDWNDLLVESVEDDGSNAPATPAPETDVAPATPGVNEQAAVTPETPGVQPETPAPELPAVTQQTPEEAKAAEAAYAAQLERLYQFNEDTALLLQTEPEKVLPALAAKLHIDVMRTVLSQVQSMLPQVMQQQTVASERESKAKAMFNEAWPELAPYEKQVLEVGKLVRQLNPTADAPTIIKLIGETAMTSLGLTRAAPATQQSNESAAPSTFRPAVPGRVTTPGAKPTEWDELLEDDD